LFPAFDNGEDAAWIGGPDEGFWIGIGLYDEVVNVGLEVVDRSKDATHETPMNRACQRHTTGFALPDRRMILGRTAAVRVASGGERPILLRALRALIAEVLRVRPRTIVVPASITSPFGGKLNASLR
jgi:hypothetical protein